MNKEIIEKETVDNQVRLFFAYRLDDDKTEYINKVVNSLWEKEKTDNAIVVFLAFVKGIPRDYAKEVVETLGKRIEKEFDTDEIKIEIKPYVNISIVAIRQIEADMRIRKRDLT